ncbi:hypothetical protein SAMN05216344_108130 [Polaromonas sp. OV174]|uniref:hypothetical protein n=1 Tax=Polaromonas sp. OV174 TaxID=1855300 RepID=UPI0008E57E3E|nr:hypothetical protein [Polaromonas sp. OV174]SFC07748.1 hypothetical protein SAMN05216344_108130 [Polaromonas sp. OV174]
MKMIKMLSSLALAVLLLGACATTAVQPGMSREEVLAHYGKPSRVVPLGTGSRLQYSGQPAGQSAVMVDLDAAGKVLTVRQALQASEFAKVESGKWTREDVEREFGRPASVDRVGSWSGDVMTYRWLDHNLQDMLFWVYLDGRNVVQRTGQGMEIPIRLNDNN